MCEIVNRTDNAITDYLKTRKIYRENKPWVIEKSPLGGRGIFAKRDILPGELIFVDSPVLIGPRARPDCEEICVGCYKNCDLIQCPRNCGLPVCSDACGNSDLHKLECLKINSWRTNNSEKFLNTNQLLRCLTPIRSLFLNDSDKDLVKLLKFHNDPKHGFEVDILKEQFHFNLSEDEELFVRFVCSVLDANAFEVAVGNDSGHLGLKGLYPLSSLANHNCSPNTTHIFDDKQRMIVRAAVFIPEGTEIFHSYVRLIWGTLTRRYLLQRTKHFFCTCERCCDPSEFGGNLSAFICQSCREIALPTHPLDLKSSWKCTKCAKTIPQDKIAIILSVLGSRVQSIDESNGVEEVFRLLDEKLLHVVASTNQMVIELKYKLIRTLGYSPRYLWKDLSIELLDRKETICRELLDLLWQIKTGKCKMRGLLLYELYVCLREKQIRSYQIGEPEVNNNDIIKITNGEDEMRNLFEEAADILMFDVAASQEIKDSWPKIDVFTLTY